MLNLLIEGGHLITPLEERFADLWIEGHLLKEPGCRPQPNAEVTKLDASGCYVTPGLIDLQVNGGETANFWGDPSAEQVHSFMQTLLAAGVTTILPTLITDELNHLNQNLDFLEVQLGAGIKQTDPAFDFSVAAREIWSGHPGCQPRPGQGYVRMAGIHLEGPCLSPQRPGVHPSQFLQALSPAILKRIVRKSVLLMTVAPELDPSGASLEYLSGQGVTVSLGHSDATAAQAKKAFEQGVRLVTHTFNALPPLHHRAPGAVGACLVDDRVSCCLIADGLHLDPLTVELVIKVKGPAAVVLVTDVAQTGTRGGGLVGSSIMLSDAVRNVVGWGCANFSQAVRMASYNPAKAIGLSHCLGQLTTGSHADVVIWDKSTLAIKHVIVSGQLIF